MLRRHAIATLFAAGASARGIDSFFAIRQVPTAPLYW